MLTRFGYRRARSPREAARLAAEPGARVYAGGTDLLGCLRDHVLEATTLVSLGRLDDLRGIERTSDGGLRIGALTSISAIASDELLRREYPGLAQAAESVASPQLRNQGTLGGNLCQRPRCWYFRGEFDCAKKGGDLCFAIEGENRYHAIFGGGPCFIVHPSDTAPALVALGAVVRILGPGGERAVPAEEFFVLPEKDVARETVLEPGEIVTEILLPPAGGRRSSYRKVRERGSWDFALASVALAARLEGGVIREASLVLGGVAPVPWRSAPAERALRGQRPDGAAARAAAAAARDAEPLERNAYKVDLVRGIVEESVLALG